MVKHILAYLFECLSRLGHLVITFKRPLLTRYNAKSVFYPDIYVDLDQLVLFFTWPRVLLRSIRGFHRRRLQFDWTECNGAILEGSDGDGIGCRTRWVYLNVHHGISYLIFAVQTKILLRYPMSQSSRHQLNYSMGSSTNVTYSHVLDCKQWYLSLAHDIRVKLTH